MESMVTDPSMSRVLVVCDKRYAEKADSRSGGVGTESTIISDKVYKDVAQEKFIPVIFEVDAQGKAYVPTFLSGRFYIDMSNVVRAGENYEHLVRTIYGRPAKQKPVLGKTPSYLLADTSLQTQTRPLLRTLQNDVQHARPHAQTRIRDYLERFRESLEDARISFVQTEPRDEQILGGIRSLLPHRDEFVEFITLAADYADNAETHREVFEFFQGATRYLYAPAGISSWSDDESDHYAFFLYEAFLYILTLLIKKRRFSFAVSLLDREYYVEGPGGVTGFKPFAVFEPVVESLDVQRNKRLNAQRASITADLLRDRATLKGVSFEELQETEFILLLRSLLKPSSGAYWFPRSLVYATGFETLKPFSLAESSRYFADLKLLLGVSSKEELLAAYDRSIAHQEWSDKVPISRGFRTLKIPRLGNFEKLATRP